MANPEQEALKRTSAHLDEEIEKEQLAIVAREPAMGSFSAGVPSLPKSRHEHLSELLQRKADIDAQIIEDG